MEHLFLFTISLIVFSANLYFLGLLWFADKHDKQVRTLMAMGVATCYWTIFDAICGIAQNYAYSYMYMLRSVMLIIAPFCLLLYVLYLSDSKLTANKVLRAIFIAIPSIDILLVLTNPLHRLVFSRDGFPLPEYGPLFVFHSAVAYLAIALGIILLFRYIIQRRPPIGFVAGWIVACTVPVIVNVLFTVGVISMSQDIAPFGFSFIFILFALYSYQSRLSNLKATALSDIFESYSDGAVLVNANNVIEQVNAAFRALFPHLNLVPETTKARELFDYFASHASDAETQVCIARITATATDFAKEEVTLQSPTGEIRTFNITRQDVRTHSGRLTGWLLIIADVSTYHRMIAEINEQNERLAVLRQKAEAASEAKSTFLANMSHEMRTPLNAIIGLSELALRRESDAATKASIIKVHESGVNLLSVINDILDISKIESGHFELVVTEYSTADMINETVSINRVRIGTKPLKLTLTVGDNLPDKLVGDDLRVRQIFNNLLSNAIKYTKEGAVALDVSATEQGDDICLQICVSDTGIGIKPEHLPDLFSEYQQVDMKANRTVEGTGLGLSITQQLVQLMGGSIEVSSVYGEGSTFTATILQGRASSERIDPATVRALQDFTYTAQRRTKNADFIYMRMPYARLLVVDDVEVNLEVARGMLEPYDLQVDCVDSGIAAVDVIRKGEPRYDLIFMDQMMPVMDGVEAVRIIREEIDTEYARTIPIVALTANAMMGSKEMFLEEGFQDFLPKPIDSALLNNILTYWIADRVR